MEESGALYVGTGPLALFWACALSGLGFPWPDELPLLVAGWQLRRGALSPYATCLAGFVGVFLRDLAAFSLGRWMRHGGVGSARLERLLGRSRMERLRRLVERFGRRALYFARYAVGFKVPLFIASGLAGDSYGRMLRINTPGILVTVPLTLWLGWRYGEAAVDFLLLHVVERPILTVAATLIVTGLLVWAWRRSAEGEGGG